MPFKSKAQQRFMFAAESKGELPKGTAKEWADATEKKKGGIEALPEKVKMKKSAGEMAQSILTKTAFWGRKKIKIWDPEELYEEQRKTDTPEQLLDTDLYNALYMSNQGMGTGLLHRKGFKYPKPGKDMMFQEYRDRISGLNPEQKQMISSVLWGAPPEMVSPMKKSAAEIAEKVCTPEEKAKCCKGESEKKDEKKDEKKENKGNPFAKKDEGNPFAKKEAASCSSSKPKKMKKSPKEIANKVWSSKKK
jgi:hypothetical protein